MKTYKRHSYRTPPMLQDPDTTTWIPAVDDNFRYQAVLAEVAAETATIEEADAPLPSNPTPTPRIATSLVATKKDILLDAEWDPIGGVSVNASFYIPDLTRSFAIVQFEHKAVGTQAQLRLVEIDANDNVRVLGGPYDIAPSAKWKTSKFQTDQVPGTGDKTYELQGRLNGATSASVRYGSVVLIELVG